MRIAEIERTLTLIGKVLSYFEGDSEKTTIWFRTDNTLLGGVSPMRMVQIGRLKKLEKFVKNSLAGNAP